MAVSGNTHEEKKQKEMIEEERRREETSRDLERANTRHMRRKGGRGNGKRRRESRSELEGAIGTQRERESRIERRYALVIANPVARLRAKGGKKGKLRACFPSEPILQERRQERRPWRRERVTELLR